MDDNLPQKDREKLGDYNLLRKELLKLLDIQQTIKVLIKHPTKNNFLVLMELSQIRPAEWQGVRWN